MKRCCSCLREFGEFLAMTQGGLGWQQKWCCFLSKGLSDELKMLCQCGFLVITNWTSYQEAVVLVMTHYGGSGYLGCQ